MNLKIFLNKVFSKFLTKNYFIFNYLGDALELKLA